MKRLFHDIENACDCRLFSAVAAAEWRYDPAPLPAGRATGEGLRGVDIVADCGNGGLPTFTITNMSPRSAEETLAVQFDGDPETILPAACQANACEIQFDSMWAFKSFLAGLRDGWVLRLGLYRGGYLTEIPLTHTRYALDEMEKRGCETR